jgi:hypothetical protein
MSRSIDVTMTRLHMPILILSRSGKKSQVGGVDRDWLMFNIFYNRDIWGSGRRRRGLCSGCCSGRSRITRGTSMVMPRELGYSSTKVRCADQDDRHPGDRMLPVENFCRPSTLCRRWVGPEIHKVPELCNPRRRSSAKMFPREHPAWHLTMMAKAAPQLACAGQQHRHQPPDRHARPSAAVMSAALIAPHLVGSRAILVDRPRG